MIFRAITSDVWPDRWDIVDDAGRRYRLDTSLRNAIQAANCYMHAAARA